MVVRAAPVLLALVLACSGKPRPEDAGHSAPPRRDAAPAVDDARAAHDARADAPSTAGGRGDLQVRVEWPEVPVVARSSPGTTPCGTPRTPQVAPTTTWGVPDALVIIDGAVPALGDAHVTLADCTLSPRIAIGGTLAITSAMDRPARLVLTRRGTLDRLEAGAPVPVQLPIAGHTVTSALEVGAIYALETDAKDPEVAFVAAVPGSYVSDASGHVTAQDLPVGTHAVTAWLPPRAGQPARIGRGTATVTDGDLATLTITLAP